jgi:hypothetical protein
MQKSSTILDELKQISQVVADLPARLPFEVPDGYFEQLPDKLAVIAKSADPESGVVNETNRNLPYSVPQGYFDNLAGDILNRIKADALAPDQEINLLSPTLSKLEKKGPFRVPEGYFHETPSNVVAGIKALDFVNSELEIVSPQLLALKDLQVFTAPDGYFEALPAQILGKIKPGGKVVTGNFLRQVKRFAAAAAVIGVMAIGLLVFNRRQESNLASDTVATELDSSIKHISDAALITYIENNDAAIPEPANGSVTNMQQADLKEMLADVSDRDLETYLEAYGIGEDNLNN